jgi:hypothetical protein
MMNIVIEPPVKLSLGLEKLAPVLRVAECSSGTNWDLAGAGRFANPPLASGYW